MACSKMAPPPFSNQGRMVVRGSLLLQLRIRFVAAQDARVVNESAAGAVTPVLHELDANGEKKELR